MPPQEGGTDTIGRLFVYEQKLVRWDVLPDQVRKLPLDQELGQRPVDLFSKLFMSLYGTPRDRILRGRFDEVTPDLVKSLEPLRNQLNLRQDHPELDEQLAQWCTRAYAAYAERIKAQAELIEAQKAAKNATAAQSRVAAAQARVDQVWEQAQPLELTLISAAAEPISAEITYQLALCRQEQAERFQAEDAWREAVEWWEKYAAQYPKAPGIAAANRLQARAREALGDVDTAIALLENPAGEQTKLEKTARLYEARQLKMRRPASR